MSVTRVGALVLGIGLLAVLAMTRAVAQEGYPLDGTWRGEWGTADDTTQVVVIMKWDGDNINGMIDPGPDALHFTKAELHPDDWTVHLEAESPDAGEIVIDGTLKDIGSYHRYIEGTWRQGGREYPVKITRQ